MKENLLYSVVVLPKDADVMTISVDPVEAAP